MIPEGLLSSRPEPLVFDLLKDGMEVEIPVTGDSMSPCVRGSDVLTLAPIGDRRIRRGDVVAFPRPDGRMVIHRVVALAGERIQTRGDAVSRADAWIDSKSLIGHAIEVDRRGQRTRWGLGRGRSLIALLSRAGILCPLLRPVRWWVRVRF